jgi:hypothetical protein
VTKDEFCRKWVSAITYQTRDSRDELLEEMYQDLESIRDELLEEMYQDLESIEPPKKANDKDCANSKK